MIWKYCVWFLFSTLINFSCFCSFKARSLAISQFLFLCHYVCETEIKNDRPGTQLMLAAVLSKKLGKGFCEGNSLSGQEGGKGRWFSRAVNTLKHQYGYMMLEKSLPSSCPAAQIYHHRWVPEDHIYKIDPASPASLPTWCLAVCRPVKESVLH